MMSTRKDGGVSVEEETQDSMEAFLPNEQNFAWKFDVCGECTRQELTREAFIAVIQEAAKDVDEYDGNGFRVRDFRQLEGAYAVEDNPAVIVRNQAILVSMDRIRAVILRHACFIIQCPSEDVVEQLKASFALHVGENQKFPFEFIALESILSCITKWFEEKTDKIQPETEALLTQIANIERPRDEFERLRVVENSLHELKAQVSSIHQHLVSLLDNDEDLHLMHLTELAQNPHLLQDLYSFDADESESLVEVYSQKMFNLLTSVELLLKKTQNTESSLNLKWTSKRNQLLMVDIPLKVLFLAGYFGSLASAMPAINVVSGIKDTDGVYWGYFSFLIVFCIWFYWLVVRHLRRQGIPISFKAPKTVDSVHDFLNDPTSTNTASGNSSPGQFNALQFNNKSEVKTIQLTRHDVLKLIQTEANKLVVTENPVKEFSRTRRYSLENWEKAVDIPEVHMRDVRMLENALSTSTEHSIAVRQQAILLNCDPIRAIIMRESCLVLLPDNSDALTQHLKRNMKENLMDGTNNPFEFIALEAVLATTCFILAKEQHKISSIGKEQLEYMAKDDSNFSVLENLRTIKNASSDLESQVNNMRHFLMELLDNEEDLHMLHLTKLYKNPNLTLDLFAFDTEDVESLLESYLQEIYRTQTDLSLIMQNIQNTEAIVMLKLDTKRNYLIVVDLLLTLITSLSAIPNFYVNAFTMNLTSGLEDVEGLFWIINGSAIVFPIVSYYIAILYMRKVGFNISWSY